MYVPHIGTFVQRDPLPDGEAILGYSDEAITSMRARQNKSTEEHPSGARQIWFERRMAKMRDQQNLYAYAWNSPLTHLDPSGLGVQTACLCKWWCENEKKNLDWLLTLPNCPCSIGSPASNPDSSWWFDPEPASPTFHPGATKCIRSIPITDGGPGQQCCYDSLGNLITGGLGAGTPDRVAPVGPWDTWMHLNADVVPFNWCNQSGVANQVLDVYLKCRPPNNGKGCPTNEI